MAPNEQGAQGCAAVCPGRSAYSIALQLSVCKWHCLLTLAGLTLGVTKFFEGKCPYA